MKKYSDSNPTSFHMPGHKHGKGLPNELLGDLSKIDLTEIPGTDNLFYPEDSIKEAQQLAAKAFGADKTYFLVNGSTCGIQVTIKTICKPGSTLIVSRDCHKSVINSMILARVEPFYIMPEYDVEFGITSAITPSRIEEALVKNPDASAVLITRPNYYGICCDIEKIAQIVHSHNKILIVDEAHGAHLLFNDKLPISAMQAGADICVQSAHKTLPAFTQAAYLHVKSDKIDNEILEYNLRMFMTSSPSYILMASLDIARSLMQSQGRGLLDGLLKNIDAFKEKIQTSNSVKSIAAKFSKDSYDKTRVVLNFESAGISGFEAAKILRQKFNIQVEMADVFNIVCICTIADSAEDLWKLADAVLKIAGENKTEKAEFERKTEMDYKTERIGVNQNAENITAKIKLPKFPQQKISLKEASEKKRCWIDIDSAVGEVCAEMVVPYPPGVPVICPGEIILSDTIDYICSIIKSGGNVNGIKENSKICVTRG